MKTPRFQLYRRSRLQTRLRNLVALENERHYAINNRMPKLRQEMEEALAWQEREILDTTYPLVSRELKAPKRGRK